MKNIDIEFLDVKTRSYCEIIATFTNGDKRLFNLAKYIKDRPGFKKLLKDKDLFTNELCFGQYTIVWRSIGVAISEYEIWENGEII